MSFDKQFEHSDKLFTAAVDEFVTHGYEQASINTILATAGMSKGQFYYHFKNKEGLYLALIDVMIGRKRQFMVQAMAQQPAAAPPTTPPDLFTLFQIQIALGQAFGRAYPEVNRFAESFLRERGNPIYERAMALHDFREDAQMHQLIAAAYQRGDLRTDLPLSFMQQVIGYLFTHITEIADLHHPEQYEAQLTYVIEFLKHGLSGRPKTAAGRPTDSPSGEAS